MRLFHRNLLHVLATAQVEVVSKKDAMQFPLIGSCVLFGLYLVVKLIKKEYLDFLISVYFAGLGAFGLYGAAQPPVVDMLGAHNLKKFTVNFHYKFWKSEREDSGEWSVQLVHRAPCCFAALL